MCTVSACDSSSPNETTDSQPATRSTITESQTGASLEIELDQTEIDLAGTVQVIAKTAWSDGVQVELIEPDWDEAGWASHTRTPGTVRFDGTRYSQEFSYTLEPFLSGEYLIPSFGIRAQSDQAGRRIARLQPIDVTVHSVLDESDSEELAPALGFAQPMSEPDQNNSAGIWIGLGVTALSLIIIAVLRVQSHEQHDEELDPEAMITAASSASQLTDSELSGLYRAVVQLSDEHAALKPIAQEIEHARFSGSAIDHIRIRTAATRAAQICGGARS